MLLRAWIVCLAVVVGSSSSPAQSTVPTAIQRKLRAIGYSSPYAESMEIYRPLLAAAPKDGIEVVKDLEYGEHRRNRLDLYRPSDLAEAPVFVFVHGGGYSSGDRDLNSEVYGNIPTYFARHGMLAINATYRLAPDASWPSGAQDMGALVRWIRMNATSYGGDPEQIFMMGHSAGATHVATYAFDSRFQPADGTGLSGVVLVSGRYDLTWDPDDPSLKGVRRYFGDDRSLYGSRSVITHVANSDVSAMLVIAEYDQRNLVATTGQLFVALCERDDGRCPRLVQLKYHNHFSEVLHINTSDDLLGKEIVDFVTVGAQRQQERSRAR